jgi:N-acetylglucosaminyldiphosphoundecaprenol N-acetyl-beta-D-mannosaminyltransferase
MEAKRINFAFSIEMVSSSLHQYSMKNLKKIEKGQKLGRILLTNNAISQEKLQKALDCQKNSLPLFRQKLLGEILIELGEITHQELWFALTDQLQQRERVVPGTKLHHLLPGGWQRSQTRVWHRTVQILNMQLDNLTQIELLHRLKQGVVLTMNLDHLMKLQQDRDFFDIYCNAAYKVCDSQLLVYISRFLGDPIKERVAGSDLFPAFCEFHRHNKQTRIFLLGGGQGVAETAKARINQKLGTPIIVGAHSPSYGFEQCRTECLEVIQKINQCRPTVLAVGLGAPKQEKWIARFKDKLPTVQIYFAIGATLDFEAGVKKRSPQWLAKLGFEWLFRLLTEPKRLWKRYLVDDMPVLGLILQQKIGCYLPPFPSSLHPSTSDPFEKTAVQGEQHETYEMQRTTK